MKKTVRSFLTMLAVMLALVCVFTGTTVFAAADTAEPYFSFNSDEVVWNEARGEFVVEYDGEELNDGQQFMPVLNNYTGSYLLKLDKDGDGEYTDFVDVNDFYDAGTYRFAALTTDGASVIAEAVLVIEQIKYPGNIPTMDIIPASELESYYTGEAVDLAKFNDYFHCDTGIRVVYTVAGNQTVKLAGTYYITVSFEHDNYAIDKTFNLTYTIKKYTVDAPEFTEEERLNTFTYNTSAQTFFTTDGKNYKANGTNVGTNAGNYTVTLTLNDTNKYEWADGTTAAKTYTFRINPAKVARPAEDTTVFVYNGTEQTYTVAENALYSVTGNKQTNAGNYVVVIALNSGNYVWDNDSAAALKYGFVISPLEIARPTWEDLEFTYDGAEHELEIDHNQADWENYYAIDGALKATNVSDSHAVTITLKNDNYVWVGGENAPIVRNITVNKKQTVINVADIFGVVANGDVYTKTYTYNGQAHTFTLPAFEEYANKPEGVTGWSIVESDASITSVGEKNVTIRITTDNNHTAVADVTVKLVVNKLSVAVPAADTTTFVYNKAEQTYVIAESEFYTVTNNKQTNAGTYNVTVALKSVADCVWADGTTEPKTYTFVINKATYDMSGITFENATDEYDGTEKVLAYVGTLPEGVTAVYSADNKLKNAGSITITLSFVVDEANYNAIPSKTATLVVTPVYVQKPAEDHTVFFYNGTAHTYKLTESEYYTITGALTATTVADSHNIVISLNDKDNYRWADTADNEDKTYAFTIREAQVLIPAEMATDFVYNGQEHEYPLFSNTYYTVHDSKQISAGVHTVTVVLNENCVWSDGSDRDIEYTFEIKKATYGFTPNFVGEAYKYNNAHQSPYVNNLSSGVEVVYTYEKLAADNAFVATTDTVSPGTYRVTATFICDEDNYYPLEAISTTYEIYLEYYTGESTERDSNGKKIVTVECSEPVADYLKLNVSDVTGARKSVTLVHNGVEAKVLLAYDIAYIGYGVEETPDGTFLVTLHVPASIRNNDNIAVVYVNDEGKALIHKHHVIGDNILFETDHFSVYAIVEVTPLAAVQADDFGYWIYVLGGTFAVCVLLLGLMAALSDKKNKKPFDPRILVAVIGGLLLMTAVILFVLFFEVNEEYAPIYRIFDVVGVSIVVLIAMYTISAFVKGKNPDPDHEPTVEEYIEHAIAEEPVEEPEAIEEPATEEVVEEPVVEEPVVEEPVVEEPVVEEPVVEEPAVEEPAVEEPAVEEPVVEEPKKAPKSAEEVESESANHAVINGEVVEVHYRSSFQSRLIQADTDIQDYYTVIKNTLLSYKGIKARTSWNFETFGKGRIKCAKVNVKGKTLVVYLNLNPVDFNINKYHFTDMSGKPKFDDAPLMMKIKSERALKYTVELIDEMMKLFEIEQGEMPDVDYHMPYEDTETLAQRGLVKVTLPAGVKLNENASITSVDVDEVINKAKEQAGDAEEVVTEEVAVEEVTEEPVAEEATEEPVAEEVTEEPVVEEVTEEPAVEEVTEEPVVEEAIEEPAVEEATEEPVVEEAIEEPAVEEVIEEPVVEEVAEEPVVEEVTEEPVAEEVTEEPVVEEATEEPVAEEVIEEPVVEEVTEEPVVEEVTEEPAEEAPVFVDATHADELITDTQAEEYVTVVTNTGRSQGKMVTLNLDIICENFENGDEVNLETLKAKRLISGSAERVKILARGIMTKQLNVTANKYSIQAVKMIVLAGGKANIIE